MSTELQAFKGSVLLNEISAESHFGPDHAMADLTKCLRCFGHDLTDFGYEVYFVTESETTLWTVTATRYREEE